MSVGINEVKRFHKASGVVGAGLLLVGLAAMFVPSMAEAIPISDVLLVPVSVTALGLGLWRVRVRYTTGVNHLELPVPEQPFALPTPGDDLDEMIYRYVHLGEATLEYPERIGERLREVAIAAIAHQDGSTREAAIDRIEEGSWTDNQYAAAFFSENVAAPEPPAVDRVMRALGRSENPYERQVRETVDAVVSVAELVDDPEPEPESDDDGFLTRFRGDDDDAQQQAAADRDRKSVLDYDSAEGEAVSDGVRYHDTIWTGRWLGIEAFALVAAGAGVVTVRPELILVGAVAVAYAAYTRLERSPSLHALSVERTLSETSPAPGDEVTVTVTVENEGGSFVPDLRLVDMVPPNMRVVDGSPRRYTALRSGAHTTLQYTVVAERGTHEWPLLAVGSGFAGSVEREAVVDPEGDTTINCLPRLRTVSDVAVRSQTTVYEGQIDTDTGGSGLEFHSVREYRPNDPMRRVNWKRKARTGELATINLREERAATIVLMFDAREEAYVADAPGSRHALDRSVDAANDVYAALSDKGDLVGAAAFDTVPCWLGPGAGTGHDEAARQLFAHHPALASLPPEMKDVEGGYIDPLTHIRRQLPSGTQVMLFSPMIGNYPSEVARRLDSSGHRVTVVSPNPTADRTVGQRLARVERAIRINQLRERGIRVVDWGAGESINLTFERANRRWNA